MGTRERAWGAWLGVCALAPGPACASAWAPPSDGTIISTTVQGVREDDSFTDTELYIELPVTARFSAVIAPRVELGRTLDPNDPSVSTRTWRGDAVVAVKALALERPHLVLSAQGGVYGVRDPGDRCSDVGGEARVLAGTSLAHVFAEAEGAYRERGGGCRGEKLDLTLGWRPFNHWLGLGQMFVDHERADGAAATMQLSVVRFTKKESGLQLGVRFRVDGESQGERAFVIGWWNSRLPTFGRRS